MMTVDTIPMFESLVHDQNDRNFLIVSNVDPMSRHSPLAISIRLQDYLYDSSSNTLRHCRHRCRSNDELDLEIGSSLELKTRNQNDAYTNQVEVICSMNDVNVLHN